MQLNWFTARLSSTIKTNK